MVKLVEKLDDGYLSSQSQKDLERINNWYSFLQHNLEQINKWCSGGPMATSPEYSGMLYNLPRCIKACQYMQEYFESILEDIQAIPAQTYTESATRSTKETRNMEDDLRGIYVGDVFSEIDEELKNEGFEFLYDDDCILPKDVKYAEYSNGKFRALVYYGKEDSIVSDIYVDEMLGESVNPGMVRKKKFGETLEFIFDDDEEDYNNAHYYNVRVRLSECDVPDYTRDEIYSGLAYNEKDAKRRALKAAERDFLNQKDNLASRFKKTDIVWHNVDVIRVSRDASLEGGIIDMHGSLKGTYFIDDDRNTNKYSESVKPKKYMYPN